jgi:hypothetical protein
LEAALQFAEGKQTAMNHPEVNYGILKSEGQEKRAASRGSINKWIFLFGGIKTFTFLETHPEFPHFFL